MYCSPICRCLRNSRETISPYLRHLIISSEREAGNTSGLLQHKRLLRLLWLKHAPLQSVILLNTLPAVIALSQYFPNITSLSYRLSRPPEFWGGILDFRNLLTVVPAFHQLILLSFDDQWILPSLRPEEDKQISGGPLPITNVEIRTSFPAIFPVLRQLEKRCKNLVSFYCDIPLISYGSDMSEEVATINNILKCNRQTLLHLTLPVHSGRSSTSVYNLSHSTFLKTLHLVLYGAPIAQHFAADSLITLDTEQIEQVVVSEGYRGALSALPAIDEVLIGRSRFTRIPQSYTSVAYSNVSFW